MTTGPGAPDEFLSKSKWVRFQVYIAGPVMNILLAMIVVLAVVLSHGADVPLYKSSPPSSARSRAGSPAEAAGLQPGDRVPTRRRRAGPDVGRLRYRRAAEARTAS